LFLKKQGGNDAEGRFITARKTAVTDGKKVRLEKY
jgi:hypothetical protein